jgi:hypothetical protein
MRASAQKIMHFGRLYETARFKEHSAKLHQEALALDHYPKEHFGLPLIIWNPSRIPTNGKAAEQRENSAATNNEKLTIAYFFAPKMASFAALATRNLTTRLAAILICSPVAGLRPMRALRLTSTSFETDIGYLVQTIQINGVHPKTIAMFDLLVRPEQPGQQSIQLWPQLPKLRAVNFGKIGQNLLPIPGKLNHDLAAICL